MIRDFNKFINRYIIKFKSKQTLNIIILFVIINDELRDIYFPIFLMHRLKKIFFTVFCFKVFFSVISLSFYFHNQATYRSVIRVEHLASVKRKVGWIYKTVRWP